METTIYARLEHYKALKNIGATPKQAAKLVNSPNANYGELTQEAARIAGLNPVVLDLVIKASYKYEDCGESYLIAVVNNEISEREFYRFVNKNIARLKKGLERNRAWVFYPGVRGVISSGVGLKKRLKQPPRPYKKGKLDTFFWYRFTRWLITTGKYTPKKGGK